MRMMHVVSPRLRRNLPTHLAVLSYLTAAVLAGFSLYRETTERVDAERMVVMRKIRDFENQHDHEALEIVRQSRSTPSPKPALHLVRGGAS
jgi:hypothetical protein